METALVLTIPEAESVVSRWRLRFDPSAAIGVPAHVTLIHPFRRWEDFDAAAEASLLTVLEVTAPFGLRFSALRRFPSTLWLAPEPTQPIVALIEALVRAFPDCPPYGGAYAEIVPHLTVADFSGAPPGPSEIERIERDFKADTASRLPLQAQVATVVLLRKDAGWWREVRRYRMGGRR